MYSGYDMYIPEMYIICTYVHTVPIHSHVCYIWLHYHLGYCTPTYSVGASIYLLSTPRPQLWKYIYHLSKHASELVLRMEVWHDPMVV